MGIGGDLRRSGLTGADSPDWLIGNRDLGKLLFGETSDSSGELPHKHVSGFSVFMLFQFFSHADNRLKSGFQRSLGFLENVRVRFTEMLAALAVTDENPSSTRRPEHLTGDLACVRAFFFPVDVLT